MSDKVAARIEGEVAYTDGTSTGFAATIDDDGQLNSGGEASAMGDIITTVKALFTAFGGSLTCTPPTSGKVVADKTALLSIQGALDASGSFECFSEYTLKTGLLVGSGGAADYAIAVSNFRSSLQTLVTAIAGVSATIT